MRGLPDTPGDTTQNHVEWSVVEEGFRLLERDLGKLQVGAIHISSLQLIRTSSFQQFVELNATGFRKILKKFDKRSTSTTKELYLARQVDVQPVFNRQVRFPTSSVRICSITAKFSLFQSFLTRLPYAFSISLICPRV
jgi:CDK inhibitor PHO81